MPVVFPQCTAYHKCINASNNNFWFRSNSVLMLEVLGEKKDSGCFKNQAIWQEVHIQIKVIDKLAKCL